jgi:hypothetical protein
MEDTYTQAREWDYNEKDELIPKKDIDFTDHGRPNTHLNPHQHSYIPTLVVEHISDLR